MSVAPRAPRLLFVTGKGGVGRTTITTALALAAGRQGRRALAVELNGVADIGRRHGHERSYEPVSIGPNTDWRSLTTRECVMDFGRRRLRLGGLGARALGSRRLHKFLEAIPGLSDLLQLGKIENLLNEPIEGDPVYDLVVVDCPATGHGLSLLDAASTMTDVSRAGLFHDLASNIAGALAHHDTGIIVVSLAERLPLSETRELLTALEERGLPADEVILNRMLPRPVPDPAGWPAVRAQLGRSHLTDLTDGVIAAWQEQQAIQRELGDVRSVPLGDMDAITEALS